MASVMVVATAEVGGADGAFVVVDTKDTSNAPYQIVADNARCFLCDHNFAEGEGTWLLFEGRMRDDGQMDGSLAEVLSSALGREIEASGAHTTLLCDDCNTTVQEFERLLQRFCEKRYEIITAYNRTAQRNGLETIAIEINGVLQDVDGTEIVLKKGDENVALGIEENTLEPDTIEIVANSSIIKEELATQLSDLVEEVKDEKDEGKIAFTIIDAHSQSAVSEFTEDSNTIKMDETLDVDNEDMIVYGEIIEQTSQNSFISEKSLEKNILSVDDSQFYSCEFCSSEFLLEQDLYNHMEEQHPPGANESNEASQFECDVCNRVFTEFRQFCVHKRTHNSAAKQYQCTECNKKYAYKNLLRQHMNMHTGKRPYKCSQCPKDFASKYTLQAHVKIHSDRQRSFKCDECGKSYLNQQNLIHHKKLHVNVKSFFCDVCSKAFGTQHNLDLHKIVHSGQRPFICRICSKAFARRAEIKDHERIHTGEKPHKCDMCPAAFAQRSNLMTHKKSTHLNQKLHKCEECGRSFKRRRLLLYHINSIHTGERPFKCETCPAAFVYPEHLKKHILIHANKKQFACEVCGKGFNSRDSRNAHRFVHSEKKAYECVQCGSGFMRKPLLLAHMVQTKHMNDTIIVNHPQISKKGDISLFTFEIKQVEDVTIEGGNEESLENIMQQAESILAQDGEGEGEGDDNDNDDDDDDKDRNSRNIIDDMGSMESVANVVDIELSKEQLSSVKYLELAGLDQDGQHTTTWVDIVVDQD